jgi:guanylate kinase
LVTVFLTPPTLHELEERLRRRGADSPTQLQKRLGIAQHEIEQWPKFQYLILSTSIPEDLRRMEAIIDAERMRAARAKFTIRD